VHRFIKIFTNKLFYAIVSHCQHLGGENGWKTNRHKLVLTEDEYRELETISGSRTKPVREVQRANILLSYANGKSISQIRKELDVSRPTVYKCIDKALAGGILLGMRDFFHQPKQAEITDEAKVWVVNFACTKPKDHGLAAEFWTLGELARFTRENAPKEGHDCLGRAAKATIWRILDEHPVNPTKKDTTWKSGTNSSTKK
jgi:transposase